jgi:hypothetical protein
MMSLHEGERKREREVENELTSRFDKFDIILLWTCLPTYLGPHDSTAEKFVCRSSMRRVMLAYLVWQTLA